MTTQPTAMDKALTGLVGPERRFLTIDTEDRAEGDATLGFRGHAAVFGTPAYIGMKPYGFWEQINPGAFKRAIKGGDVRMLHNHDPNLALARTTIKSGPGSLALTEVDKGLHTAAEFIDTSYARDVHEQVRTGVVSQMSFSFTPAQEKWAKNDEGEDVRTLHEVRLSDVSTVTYPAYTETDAAVRSAGLGLLMDAIDLDDEQRVRIVSAIRVGFITPDLLPALRSAAAALAELAARQDQAPATPDGTVDPLIAATESVRRRMRLIASRSADYDHRSSR